MTKRLLILFSLALCFNSWGITHAECDTLKSDINSRLDTIDSSVSYALSYVEGIDDIILNTYTARFSTTDPTDPGTYQSTSSTYYYDSSCNPLGTLDEIHTKLNSIRSDIQVVTNNTAYIRGLLLTVNCDDTPSINGCNCAEQLSTISQQVDSIFGQVSIIASYTLEVANSLYEFYDYLQQIIDREDLIYNATSNIVYDLSFLGSQFLREYLTYDKSALPTMTASYFTPGMFRLSSLTTNNNILRSIFDGTRGSGSLNVSDLLVLYGRNVPAAISSINNYLYNFSRGNTNLLKSVDSGISSISNKFSIFNDFVFSSESPLSMYNDTDGSYHDYLTNYYIKVSKGRQSGSDSFTNWFSRVELLLAALVFQDEDDSTINTNGVPSESDKNSVTEIGSSLDQTISGFVQDGNSHVSSVDTSGKSIIRMVTSWNTAIGQTAKPAPFVVAEFSTPDSQSRSNISLYFDTEDEKLSSLIEIGHGISTLAWVAVFLLLGYNLAVYSIRVLRRLISFSFSLYSAIFGGG